MATFDEIQYAERNQLVEQYYYVINQVLHGKFKSYAYNDDVIQWGALGLLSAANYFKADKNCKFTTFAYGWVEKFVKKGIFTELSGLHYKPATFLTKSKINQLIFRFAKEHHRTPTDEELAELCGWTIERFRNWRDRYLQLDAVHIDEVVFPACNDYSIEAKIHLDDVCYHLRIMLRLVAQFEKLENAQQAFKRLRMLYGLYPTEQFGQRRTLDEVGKLEGTKREAIRQSKVKAWSFFEAEHSLYSDAWLIDALERLANLQEITCTSATTIVKQVFN